MVPSTQDTQSLHPQAVPDRDHPLSLIEHLKELRSRLMKAAVGVLAGMAAGMYLVLGPLQLVDIIIRAFAPTDNPYPPLQAVSTTETFTSYMTVALGIGFIIGMPAIVYQLLMFVSPGLTRKERNFILIALPFVTLFFLAGLTFGWFVTVPVAIRFLIGFGGSALIASQPTLSDFLRTVTMMLLMNGVVFELPLIIYILAWMRLVTAQQLSRYRRYAVLVVAIVAAIITPTGDPVNLMLLALPMYVLFEFGVLLARMVPPTDQGDSGTR